MHAQQNDVQSNTQKNIYKNLLEDLSNARTSKDQKALADAYYKLADFEEQINRNLKKSFDYYTRASEYYKVINDNDKLIATRWKIARHFYSSENYSTAAPLYQDVADFYEKKKQLNQYCNAMIDLAKTYAQMMEVEKKIEVLENIEAANLALQNDTISFEVDIQRIEQYFIEKRYEKALEKSLNIFKKSNEMNNNYYTGKSLFYLGCSNKFLNKPRVAIKYLEQSLNYLPVKPLDEHRLKIYELLNKTFAQILAYKSAYQYGTAYSSLRDSILNTARVKAINNLTVKYESREKSTEIKLLEKEKIFAENKNDQQRRALYILAFGLGLLSLTIYYIVRFYNQRIKANRIINSQKDEIAGQRITELENRIKINSMQSMIEGQEQERERIASDLHDSLGGLLSAIKLQFGNVSAKDKSVQKIKSYGKANELLDTAVKEVRFISQNLQPGALSDLGMVAAIKDLINRVESSDGPEIHFQYYDIPKDLDKILRKRDGDGKYQKQSQLFERQLSRRF